MLCLRNKISSIILIVSFFILNNEIVYSLEDFQTPLLEMYESIPKHLPHNIYLNANHAEYHASKWVYELNELSCLDPMINAKLSGILPNIHSYMSIAEILFLLPNHHTYGININESVDLARLLQFFEVTRYLDSFYSNKTYNSSDYKDFYVSLSPRYLKLYDQQDQLLCLLDRYQNRLINFSRVGLSSWNFIDNMKKTWNQFFKFIVPKYSEFHKEYWLDSRIHEFLNVESSSKWVEQNWYFNRTKTNIFSKKNVFSKKYRELVEADLNPLDPKVWDTYSYKLIKVINPLFLKWGNYDFLVKRNLSLNDFNNQYKVATKARSYLNNNKEINNNNIVINNLLQECLSFVKEINTKNWEKTNEFTNNFSSTIPKERDVNDNIKDKSSIKIDFINDESLIQVQPSRNIDYSIKSYIERQGAFESVSIDRSYQMADEWFNAYVIGQETLPIQYDYFIHRGDSHTIFDNFYRLAFFKGLYSEYEKHSQLNNYNLEDFNKKYLEKNIFLLNTYFDSLINKETKNTSINIDFLKEGLKNKEFITDLINYYNISQPEDTNVSVKKDLDLYNLNSVLHFKTKLLKFYAIAKKVYGSNRILFPLQEKNINNLIDKKYKDSLTTLSWLSSEVNIPLKAAIKFKGETKITSWSLLNSKKGERLKKLISFNWYNHFKIHFKNIRSFQTISQLEFENSKTYGFQTKSLVLMLNNINEKILINYKKLIFNTNNEKNAVLQQNLLKQLKDSIYKLSYLKNKLELIGYNFDKDYKYIKTLTNNKNFYNEGSSSRLSMQATVAAKSFKAWDKKWKFELDEEDNKFKSNYYNFTRSPSKAWPIKQFRWRYGEGKWVKRYIKNRNNIIQKITYPILYIETGNQEYYSLKGWEINPIQAKLNNLFFKSNNMLSYFHQHKPAYKVNGATRVETLPGVFVLRIKNMVIDDHVFVGYSDNKNWLNQFPLNDIFSKNIKNIRDNEFTSGTSSSIYCNPTIDWKQINKLFQKNSYNNKVLDLFLNKWIFYNKFLLEKLRYHYFLNVVKDINTVNKGYLTFNKTKNPILINFNSDLLAINNTKQGNNKVLFHRNKTSKNYWKKLFNIDKDSLKISQEKSLELIKEGSIEKLTLLLNKFKYINYFNKSYVLYEKNLKKKVFNSYVTKSIKCYDNHVYLKLLIILNKKANNPLTHKDLLKYVLTHQKLPIMKDYIQDYWFNKKIQEYLIEGKKRKLTIPFEFLTHLKNQSSLNYKYLVDFPMEGLSFIRFFDYDMTAYKYLEILFEEIKYEAKDDYSNLLTYIMKKKLFNINTKKDYVTWLRSQPLSYFAYGRDVVFPMKAKLWDTNDSFDEKYNYWFFYNYIKTN